MPTMVRPNGKATKIAMEILGKTKKKPKKKNDNQKEAEPQE